MQTIRLGLVALAAILGLGLPVQAHGDDAAALKDRLRAVAKATNLSGEAMQPYYLKMSVQLTDKKSKQSTPGTIEIYWGGAGREKRIYAFPSYSATEIRARGDIFRTPKAAEPPEALSLLVDRVLHPVAQESDIDKARLQDMAVPLGKAKLDCIMLGPNLQGAAIVPMGLFPTYCFDPGQSVLRAELDYGIPLVTRDSIVSYLNHDVARVLSANGDEAVAKAQIVTLNPQAVPDSALATDGLQDIGSEAPVKATAAMTKGAVISNPPPGFPPAARGAGLTQGKVALQVVIGRDGHVYNPQVVTSDDREFSDAALIAVHSWTFKPFTLNGVPVAVEMNVNVNFEDLSAQPKRGH